MKPGAFKLWVKRIQLAPPHLVQHLLVIVRGIPPTPAVVAVPPRRRAWTTELVPRVAAVVTAPPHPPGRPRAGRRRHRRRRVHAGEGRAPSSSSSSSSSSAGGAGACLSCSRRIAPAAAAPAAAAAVSSQPRHRQRHGHGRRRAREIELHAADVRLLLEEQVEGLVGRPGCSGTSCI
jgi:hypothetical protein